jgi:hypothetical protein
VMALTATATPRVRTDILFQVIFCVSVLRRKGGVGYSYVDPQSNELTRGPPELVQHFRLEGEFTSVQERCMA